MSRADDLAEALDAPHRHGGNPGYPAQATLSAYVMQFALNERYANAFLNRLGSDETLLKLCGLNRAPSEGAYCRFKKKLTDHLDVVEGIIADVFRQCGDEIERLREDGIVPSSKPPLGSSLVMDSTDILAWARPGRKSRRTGAERLAKDVDARWGHRTAKNARSYRRSSKTRRRSRKDKRGDADAGEKDELYFGYKVNVIADADYGLPLYAVARPANASDAAVMIPDLDACLSKYGTLRPRYFLGDKGYDSLENIKHVASLGIMPVIAVRQPTRDEDGRRLYDGIYDAEGRPTCIGGKPMEYIDTDPDQGHRFRCLGAGCHLKDQVDFSRYCDSEHYEKPKDRLLRIIGLLPRCSEEWKAEYRKRPSIERYFSSAKQSRLLDTHRCLNIRKVSLHVAVSLLTYLATALASLKADDYAGMRNMRIKLPGGGTGVQRDYGVSGSCQR